MKELIYVVEEIEPKTNNILYHLGAYSSYKQANAYCEQLTEILPKKIYIVERIALDTI